MTKSKSFTAELKTLFDEAEESEEWQLTRDEITFQHNLNIGKIGNRPSEMIMTPAHSALRLSDRYEIMLSPLNITHLYYKYKYDDGEHGETAARKILYILGSRTNKNTILCQLLALELIDQLSKEKEHSEISFDTLFKDYDAEGLKEFINEELANPNNTSHKKRFMYIRAICDALLEDKHALNWKIFITTFPFYSKKALATYNRCVHQEFDYDEDEYSNVLRMIYQRFTDKNAREINIEINGIISRL